MKRLALTAVAAVLAGQAEAQTLGTYCAPVVGCRVVTCKLVRWAVATQTQDQLNTYKAQLTPAQIEAGKACLGPRPSFKSKSNKFKNKGT